MSLRINPSLTQTNVIIGIASLATLALCTALFARARKKPGTEPLGSLGQGRVSVWTSVPFIGRLFTPRISIKVEPIQISIGSKQSPITSMDHLKGMFKTELQKYTTSSPTKKLEIAHIVIYGDELKIDSLDDLFPLIPVPKKLILIGATIYHDANERNSLKSKLSKAGWEFHDALSLDEALKAPVKLTTEGTQPIPTVHTVVVKN
ncbi:MAG TPA: hypothetical protein VFU89_00810 [Rhabdochlamydiaceae bacterium]|nr:hypothetical protein [Rhabdochlamydiaceae bacterium]